MRGFDCFTSSLNGLGVARRQGTVNTYRVSRGNRDEALEPPKTVDAEIPEGGVLLDRRPAPGSCESETGEEVRPDVQTVSKCALTRLPIYLRGGGVVND